jgi:hypothetical protein
MGELVDKKAHGMTSKLPGVSGGQQDEGIILDCNRWFFRVALDAIGIGKDLFCDSRSLTENK